MLLRGITSSHSTEPPHSIMSISKDSFRANSNPMWIYEAGTGVISDANPAALQLFDLPISEFVGKTPETLNSAIWTVSETELISREASHRTGRADRILIVQIDLEDGPKRRRLALAPVVTNEPQAFTPSSRLDNTFHKLLEYLPQGLLILHPDEYEILGVSDGFLHLVGRDRRELVGHKLLDLVSDETQENILTRGLIQTSLELVKQTGQQDIIPVFCYTPSQRPEAECYWAASNTPVFDDDGRIEFIIYQVEEVPKAVSQFISDPISTADERSILTAIAQNQELKRSNQQLREKEAYLSNVQSLLEIANWRFDYKTGAILWSENAANVLRLKTGAPPANLDEYFALIHPEDRDRVQAIFRSFRESEEPQLSFSYRLGNGDAEEVHLRGKGTLVDSAKGMTLTGVVQNVTRELQTNSEMDLLRQCVSRVNDIIIVTEARPIDAPEGPRIIFVNEAFERLTGYSAAEALGQTPRILQGPGTDPEELRRIRDALTHWRPIRSEVLNYTKDGTPFWIEMDIVPVGSESGWFTHWIAIERDITERRKVEERLRKSERLEALGQLTGGIAHDFNNYLTVLMGNSETLVKKLPPGPLNEMAALAAEASKSAADLVKNLLAFAKRQALEPATIDANLRIRQFADMLRRTFPENIRIELDLEPGLGLVRIDPSQFESTLLNLCVNSRDAMPKGGQITISSRNTKSVKAAPGTTPVVAGDWVSIRVSDTGTGMTEAQLRHAFEPFFTTKPPGVGTGLGLSSVYGFVAQSGGHVFIDSEVDHGTIVRLYFPRAHSKDVSQIPDDVETPDILPAAKVLVVEDNQFVLAHVCRQLSDMGLDAITARSGPEALKQIEAHPDVTILFTDVVLPGGMDGPQIADQVREMVPSVKVIYTTGYTENTIVHNGKLDPSINLLRKPYTETMLRQKIIEVLQAPNRD